MTEKETHIQELSQSIGLPSFELLPLMDPKLNDLYYNSIGVNLRIVRVVVTLRSEIRTPPRCGGVSREGDANVRSLGRFHLVLLTPRTGPGVGMVG